jgi:hypothetical protein
LLLYRNFARTATTAARRFRRLSLCGRIGVGRRCSARFGRSGLDSLLGATTTYRLWRLCDVVSCRHLRGTAFCWRLHVLGINGFLCHAPILSK